MGGNTHIHRYTRTHVYAHTPMHPYIWKFINAYACVHTHTRTPTNHVNAPGLKTS